MKFCVCVVRCLCMQVPCRGEKCRLSVVNFVDMAVL